jgi:hypothetical protein
MGTQIRTPVAELPDAGLVSRAFGLVISAITSAATRQLEETGVRKALKSVRGSLAAVCAKARLLLSRQLLTDRARVDGIRMKKG